MTFHSIEEMIIATAEMVRPPERLTVSEAAEKYRYVNNPGSYVGDWHNSMTPYLVEPQDLMTSTAFQAVIFAGPAQCGKTDMFLNYQTYTVVCDPADMMLIQTSQTTARDFSKRRIDRLHRHSKEVGKRLVQRRNYDNTYDKQYSSGMMVTLSWPAINELSGKPIPRLWLTDYDRMPQDVDGEGPPFDLARKRGTTFGRYSMTVAESSPGFVVMNPKWMPSTRHEAPPTEGILALYNRGDRRRWYWRCVQCKATYEPDFSLLDYPDCQDEIEAGEQATMICPHCGFWIHHETRDGRPGKHEMNQLIEWGGNARWVKDGQIWTPENTLTGTPFRSDIASFWLKGAAAAFADWKVLVINYIKAKREYERTGDEGPMKATVTVDQGNAYTPKSLEGERLPEDLKSRARDLGLKHVPFGVRFLLACIDVQKRRFVVQVMGYGVGGDVWIVDRFDVNKSDRLDEDGDPLPISPGAYPEDWRLLVDRVMRKSYPLIDGSGREMQIKFTFCDSGGEEGVTTNAYNFWRWLRDDPDTTGLHGRFVLVKGSPKKEIPRVVIGYPDSARKDRHAGARGEIPVMFINSNQIKDQLDKKLDRLDPNGGRVNFPSWLPDTFYTELTVEIKTHKGWENPRGFRNESWDLLAYGEAGIVSRLINIERFDWSNPPSWAEEWDYNDLVFDATGGTKRFEPKAKAKYDLGKLAEALA